MPTTVFISYSHDSPEYKSKINEITDQLREFYEIDAYADFYEEDVPTGKLISEFMHSMKNMDKVLAFLSLAYKKKSDEGKGGVGYEGMLMTEELFNQLGTDKIIPVIVDDKEVNLKEYYPNCLSPLRKGVFRHKYQNDADFIEAIARAITNKPVKPKPPLGNSGWIQQNEKDAPVESLNEDSLINPENGKLLFDHAIYIVRKKQTHEFMLLNQRVKNASFKKLDNLREKYKGIFNAKNEEEKIVVLKEFISAGLPIFLMAFAGYLSGVEDFSKQEGVMFDLLTINNWSGFSDRIQAVPEMFVYIYHHIYGALHVGYGRLQEIVYILETKLPVPHKNDSYECLFKQHELTGWCESFGGSCYRSFEILLDTYNENDSLKALFVDENQFKNQVVAYQMIIHLLDYFDYLKNNNFSGVVRLDIPPGFLVSDSVHVEYAKNYIVKNSEFFKSYLEGVGISKELAIKQWSEWCSQIKKNNRGKDYGYLPESFIINLLT